MRRTILVYGLAISTVASITYVGVWEVNLAVTDHAFIDEYTSSLLAAKQAEGMAAEELRALSAEMEELKGRYANPWLRMSMTFLEIFPVGLLTLLISALVLRNTQLMAAVQPG